ncbi:Oidioi.mRNA.OKI2018_I69.PAR.g9990.t1.cds [Oikopleura dioica]|uniref:Oidioi.mRNA.OKI2018_I69.PAR.g9990.t1.cds n=1 Tax=Oikopleura dioica TaxID=34765 RepID=A0ABN7RNJ7_OIKDI|nr:Oidioi.mRNA.OKI2018_I69.PAR.g9990.t1.cds [Oikopleura dioica]
MVIFGQNSAVLITGANRGYGEAIAREFLSRLDKDSLLLLHSRNGTIPWLEKEEKKRCEVKILKGDLGEPLNWMELIKTTRKSYRSAFLISNAGTCGDIEKPLLETGHSLEELSNFWTSNVAQFIPLATAFKNTFSESKLHIVNITTLLSKVNVPKCSLYSASRRARNCLLEGNVDILEKDEYISGEYIDLFDVWQAEDKQKSTNEK